MKRPLITAAFAAALVATPAFAASGQFDMALTYDRSAMETPEGAQAEYMHIRSEVAERCRAEHEDFPQFGRDLAVSLCTARTLDKAIRAINQTALTEVHAARKAG